jgi:DNA uptake protein ComE-like DNA-binding protein
VTGKGWFQYTWPCLSLIAQGSWQVDNGTVRARLRITAMAAAVLCISLAGLPQGGPRPKAIPPPEARTDINHATPDELLKVPGMTRSWAGRIVRFRPYRTKLDLLDKGVLSSQVYDRIKDYVIAHRDKQ